MVQNGTFVPTVFMQGELELVVSLKYIIMRIFSDIICMTVLPWQHQFKIFCRYHLQNALTIWQTVLVLDVCNPLVMRVA